MKLKKNPNKDLNLKRGLYFVIGLLFLLALIYIALEWKTQDDNGGYDIENSPNKENLKEDSTIVLETNANRNNLFAEAINFATVEEPPIFPGCENAAERRSCFNRMMLKHIMKNFHYPETTENLGLYSKIFAHFVIKKDGSIDAIKIKAPEKNVETALRYAIEKLPQITPAISDGHPINISYSVPINIHWKN